jgi:hypothetical protein
MKPIMQFHMKTIYVMEHAKFKTIVHQNSLHAPYQAQLNKPHILMDDYHFNKTVKINK